jgi:alpha-D-ribose 1-methylphosphonate 5-triphosphate synthase subunit PhnG
MIARKRRTEILINGNRKISRQISQEISSRYEIVELEEPNEGLVMVRMRETARNSLFNLGEVLITEAKVMINDSIGIGIVEGHRPDLARELAVIDAAWTARLPECEGWEKLLDAEEKSIQERRRAETRSVLDTRVRFETMDTDSGVES